MRLRLLPVVLAALLPAACFASTITPVVTSSAGTIYNTPALTGYATTNLDMVGSVISVVFADGTTGTAVWTPTGAFGSGWSLTLNGNSDGVPFHLLNSGSNPIVTFSFDGVPGNTTFDIVQTPVDSPGSATGNQITEVTGPAGLSVDALYTNELQVDHVFYGDEYTKLIVTLGGGGLGSGQELSFLSDTDNAVASAGITIASTPEPSSLILLGTGILSIGAAVRRRIAVS